MKVAVVGGGWAGMAATHVLTQAGHEVTVFELSHQLGGRARGLQDPVLGSLDNGQHLLIGAYQQTLALILAAHGPETTKHDHPAFWRLPLRLLSVDQQVQINIPNTHASRTARLFGLLRAQGFNRRERWQIIRFLGKLSLGFATPRPEETVICWLQSQQQSARTLHLLWVPLCLATMNTAPDVASAPLFARILQDSLLSKQPGATDLIIPRCDLTDLWSTAVARRARLQLGAHIDRIMPIRATTDPMALGSGVMIQDQLFDACIVATPPSVTAKLARQWPGADAAQLCQTLEQFSFLPITTCYVTLDRPLSLPYPMMMLSTGHGPNAKGLGQWVFDRRFILQTDTTHASIHDNDTGARLAFVISHAGQAEFERQTFADRLVEQLWNELRHSNNAISSEKPNVVHQRIITEKRATFAAIPGLSRPSVHSPWPQIKLAGDWTDTGYPAVLEGAVMSGMSAARALIQDYSDRKP